MRFPTKAIRISCALALVLAGVFGTLRMSWDLTDVRGSVCAFRHADDVGKIDCWFDIVASHIRAGDLTDAYAAFSRLKNRYPLFLTHDCHTRAHKLGDTAYKRFYVDEGKSVADMTFEPVMALCGYGFFHGLIEHVVQNHSDPVFVKRTCDALISSTVSMIPFIEAICYQGAGHGFMQQRFDTLEKSAWGDAMAAISVPLAQCASLPVSEDDKQRCREGVLFVLLDWMKSGDLDFSLDRKHPFAFCSALAFSYRDSCEAMVAEQLAGYIQDDPVLAANYAATLSDSSKADHMFTRMLSTVLKRPQIHPRARVLEDLLTSCKSINVEHLRKICIDTVSKEAGI